VNELIPISQRQIAGELTDTIDARELHAFLENGDAFANWIRDRIRQFGFAEGVDFTIVLENTKTKSGGGTVRREYFVTVNMAKELAMVERNDKGKQARLYFIECERRAKAAMADSRPPLIVTGDALVSMAIAIRDHQIQAIQFAEEQARLNGKCVALEIELDRVSGGQKEIAAGQKAIAARQMAIAARQMASEEACNEFTVMGYANYREVRIDLPTASKVGRRATAITKQMGLTMRKIRDPRFGLVNSYPEEALEQAFAEAIKDAAL